MRRDASAWRGLIVPVLMVLGIVVIVVPLPAALLDLLLSANLAIAVVILLTSLYVRRPLEFSSFPALLLGTTLLRLVLNIASTRLILSRGASDGTAAAGHVIEAFGEFVASGQIVVGFVIFLILLAIQFLVITQGSARISEVAARFALDGLPGRQMAIDSDLQAGSITPEQARKRREELSLQADFYGSMDGAGKFVRGDALASLVITLINIAGGLYVGIIDQGMPVGEAFHVFTRLTIGDGLVTQLPAFLIALGAGLLTTRSSADSDLPGQMVGQLFVRAEALIVAACLLAALSFTGLPKVPLLTLAAILAAVAYVLRRATTDDPAGVVTSAQSAPPSEPKVATARPEDRLFVEDLQLELGYGLIRLADAATGGDLLERVARVRTEYAQDMGALLPRVKVRDNLRLDQRRYQILIHDVPVAWGEIVPDAVLAVETAETLAPLPGMRAFDPVEGRPAVWIEPAHQDRAHVLGYRCHDACGVIALHLADVVRQHCDELLSRQQVYQLLEALKQRAPRLVDELIPGVISASQLHQVLCQLLHERVPIRNLETILATLGDHAERGGELWRLTERVRQALARTICQKYRDASRSLKVLTLDPELEAMLSRSLRLDDSRLDVQIAPAVVERLLGAIAEQIDLLAAEGRPPVVVTGPELRPALKRLTESALPALVLLSAQQITRATRGESLTRITLDLQPRLTPAARFAGSTA
ncbi:MAG: flagellar type III secretion system protein FlhA [Planctomycetaceae bacterium]|nr:MAG: flagellar type III secretion system protein FlhA [Planctomycetaceae bacterium]